MEAGPILEDGDGFLYPLRDAHANAMAHEEPWLRDLLARSECVRLVSAIYSVETSASGLDRSPLAPVAEVVGQKDSLFATAKWNLIYVNEAHEAVAVQTLRSYHPQGHGDAGTTVWVPPGPWEDYAVRNVTGTFLRPDAVLEWADADAGLPFRADTSWTLSIHFTRSASPAEEPTYLYRVSDRLQAADRRTALVWDARDGALLSNTTEQQEVAQTGPAYVSTLAPTLQVVADDFESLVPASAAAAGLLVLAAYAWNPAKALLAAGAYRLYAKIPTNRLLSHPRRSRMMDLVRADPGLSLSEVRERLDVRWGPLLHHLGALEAQRFLVTVKVGKERCVFVPGSYNHSDLAAVALLRNAAARRVWEHAQANPGQTPQQLAERLGLARATVHFHARRLQEVGLLDVQVEGRTRRCVARPAPRPAA